MAITTLDGALAGMQYPRYFCKAPSPNTVVGRPHSAWYLAGIPGAGTMDAATTGGVALSQTAGLVSGAIPFTDPGAGNSYLARFVGDMTSLGTLMLCDRLWHGAWQTTTNAAFVVTSTSAQTITSATLPARDVAGSTNGDGVLAAMETYAANGAGTPTVTLTYTNQAGTGSRSSTNIDAVSASSAIGAFHRFGLQAGDTGVRQINTVQLSATMTSGNVGFVLYRVLASLDIPVSHVAQAVDCLTAGLPRMYNGTTPFLVFIPSGAGVASKPSGQVIWTQG